MLEMKKYFNILKLLKYLEKKIADMQSSLIRIRIISRLKSSKVKSNPKIQQLDVYYEENFKNNLVFWGEDTVWKEIEYLLCTVQGKGVDMCCGVGSTIRRLEKYSDLDIYGFDISEFLIEEAIKSGLNADKLKVADATNTKYDNKFFKFSYSIGSLEHFTEVGIDCFIREARRISNNVSYHQIPVARDDKFNGWLELDQSYYNMPVSWWIPKFKKHFDEVVVIDSFWDDPISYGKWFICK